MWGYPHLMVDIPMEFLSFDGQSSKIVTRTALPIQSVAAILKSDLDQGWGFLSPARNGVLGKFDHDLTTTSPGIIGLS